MQEEFAGTAYSYIRFSSREQDQGDSIRRQRQLRDDWLAKHPAVILDTTLGGEDRGVSAFRGKHRTDKHHLGRFLEAVRLGKVRAGSILLLESLDRLSREEEEESLSLLLSLLNAGVMIVQLEPYTVFRKGDGMMGLMRAIIFLSRAREESATKSVRITKVWQQKVRDAQGSGKIVTGRAPGWLEVVDGKFRFKPGALSTIKRIFKRCVEGHGARMIARDLHRDGVPPFDDGHKWECSYVTNILRNQACVGRYQPKHRVAGKRVASSEPIEGYFPVAVPLDQWHAAQAARKARKTKGGRRGNDGWVALFGSVYDARTGERLQAILRLDRGRRYHVLQPAGVLRWQSKCVSFPLASFEAAVHRRLRELKLADVFPVVDDANAKVSERKGVLADIESRIERLQAAMVEGERDADALPVLRQLGERKRKAAADLAEAERESASPSSEQLKTIADLDKLVETDPDARLRYRAAAGRLIERFDVLIVATTPHAARRLAVVQVRFRDSEAVRSYLIAHDNAKVSGKHKKVISPASWVVTAYNWIGDELDLRRKTDIERVEADLIKAADAGPRTTSRREKKRRK